MVLMRGVAVERMLTSSRIDDWREISYNFRVWFTIYPT